MITGKAHTGSVLLSESRSRCEFNQPRVHLTTVKLLWDHPCFA